MKILVDADACPVKEIVSALAKKRGIPVILLSDTSHELRDEYCEIVTVDQGKDGVDIALVNLAQQGDVVVTQDYGVAAMALGRGAAAIHHSGMIFSGDNIDRLLFERHLGQKSRRAGMRTAAIKKRTKEDDERFRKALEGLLAGMAE